MVATDVQAQAAIREIPALAIQWRTTPSAADLGDVYPGFARMIEVRGRVTLTCPLGGDGRLTGCAVVSAHPPGLGFDQAALPLMSRFQADAPQSLGRANVRVTMNFRIEDEPIVPYEGPPPSPAALALAERALGILQERGDLPSTIFNTEQETGGLAPDRLEFVRERIREVEAEYGRAYRDATVLVLARLYGERALRRFLEGSTLVTPDLDEFGAAFDEMERIGLQAAAHVRSRYCAAYSCVVPADAD